MYFILYNFVQPKLNLVQPPNHPEIQFHFTGAAVTLHQHPDQLFFTNFNFKPYSIMYFILYNFVQPPNLPKIQFHFTSAAVTLHQYPDQLFFTNFNFKPYSIMYFILYQSRLVGFIEVRVKNSNISPLSIITVSHL
jgi:hypothetical protein